MELPVRQQVEVKYPLVLRPDLCVLTHDHVGGTPVLLPPHEAVFPLHPLLQLVPAVDRRKELVPRQDVKTPDTNPAKVFSPRKLVALSRIPLSSASDILVVQFVVTD